MDKLEFLMEAEYIAALHPGEELAAAFLDAIKNSDSSEQECVNLASKLIVKVYHD